MLNRYTNKAIFKPIMPFINHNHLKTVYKNPIFIIIITKFTKLFQYIEF